MLQQQVNDNKVLMQQMMQHQAQMTDMMQMMMNTFTARQGNGIDVIPHIPQPTQSHVPASPAMTATSRNMPPPSPKSRTPGPRSKQVDLTSQTLITEAIRGTPPHPTHTQPIPAMSGGQQPMDTQSPHTTTRSTPHAPTPTSSRDLTLVMGNASGKPPPTPQRPIMGKRPRIGTPQ